jgi:CRP-like cAMP-binding protein
VVRVIEPAGESLAGIRLFADLDASARETIARLCQGRRVPAGHELVHDGDTTDDVYFVVSGKVRATIFAVSGKEVSFRDLGPGESVGDLSAIDGRSRSATVVAIEESTVLSMTSSAFWTVLENHTIVSRVMLKQLSAVVRALSDRVVEYSTLGVKNRIHAELLRLAGQANSQGTGMLIRPAPTHAEMASRISTHREAVTRELRHLASLGLLERRDGGLLINDLSLLEKMVDDVKGL